MNLLKLVALSVLLSLCTPCVAFAADPKEPVITPPQIIGFKAKPKPKLPPPPPPESANYLAVTPALYGEMLGANAMIGACVKQLPSLKTDSDPAIVQWRSKYAALLSDLARRSEMVFTHIERGDRKKGAAVHAGYKNEAVESINQRLGAMDPVLRRAFCERLPAVVAERHDYEKSRIHELATFRAVSDQQLQRWFNGVP